MWFKNIKAYHLTQPLSLDDDAIQAALQEFTFRPCGNQDLASMGFCSPFSIAKQGNDAAALFHRTGNRFWVTLKKQERLLPSSVVNAELAEKVTAIEAETGSPVGKKQQQDLKQEIVHALLPRAFTKNTFTHAFLSLDDDLVIVDSSSDGKAEALLAMLRKALGSLPVVPLARHSLQDALTEWLVKAPPTDFSLLEEAELKSTDEAASVVRCKNQPLDSEEIINHVEAGKLVQKLAFEYNDVLTGILCEDGTIKRVKFSDRLQEEVEDIPKDEALQRLDAEFALMSAEVSQFVTHVKETLDLSAD